MIAKHNFFLGISTWHVPEPVIPPVSDSPTKVPMVTHADPTPRKCAGCSKEIIAGRGKFIFNPTTREIKFSHGGRCFLMAGGSPGGPSTRGEMNSLISHMRAHDWMTESDAAEVVLWREWRDASKVGFGLFGLLPVLGILAGLGLLGAVLGRIVSRQSGSW